MNWGEHKWKVSQTAERLMLVMSFKTSVVEITSGRKRENRTSIIIIARVIVLEALCRRDIHIKMWECLVKFPLICCTAAP